MILLALAGLLFTDSGDTLKYNNCNSIRIKEIINSELSKHEFVELRCNRIEAIEGFPLKNVKYLDLRYNPLKSLEGVEFDSLIHLNISFTPIHEIPESLCQAGKLRYIDAREVYLKQLPECFCNTAIEVLNVSVIQSPLPASIAKCNKLKNITLVLMDSVAEQQTFDQLATLQNLTNLGLWSIDRLNITSNIKHNIVGLTLMLKTDDHLPEVIDELSTWRNLRHLEISINGTTAPKEIGKLREIHTLIITTKSVRDARVIMPPEIKQLQSLQTVFEYKNFKELPVNKNISIMRRNFNRDGLYAGRGYKVVEYQDPSFININQ